MGFLRLTTELLLFLLSFIQSAGAYLLIIRYALSVWRPPPIPKDYTFIVASVYAPEIEIPLYLAGFVFIMVCTLGAYAVMKYLVSRIDPQRASINALFLVWTSLLSLVILALVVTNSRIPLSYAVYAYMVFVLATVLILPARGRRTEKMFRVLSTECTIALALALSVLSTILLWKLFFTNYFRSVQFIELLQKENLLYLYFTGFVWWQFLLVTLSFVVSFLLYLFPPRYLIRIFKNKILNHTVDILAVVGIIAFSSVITPWTFVDGQRLFGYDFRAFMGTINDILGGKTVLVDSFFQYGLILPYALSVIFHFIPLNHTNFFYVNYVINTLGYILMYAVARKWMRSIFIPILFILLIPLHHYYSLLTNVLFNDNITFIRFGWWTILLLYFLVRDEVFRNRSVATIVELLLVGTAVFWAFDVGVYVLFAYVTYTFIRVFLNNRTLRVQLSAFARSLFLLCLTLILFFSIFNGFSFVRAGEFPHWKEYFFHTAIFSSGYGSAKLPLVGQYQIFLLLHLGMVGYVLYWLCIRADRSRELKRELPLVGFVTAYAIFQFLYYVGESRPNLIQITMLPSLMLLVWLLSHTRKILVRTIPISLRLSHKMLLGSAAIAFTIAFGIINTVGVVNAVNLYRYRKPLTYYTNTVFENYRYLPDIQWLKNYFAGTVPYKRKLALITEDDYYFLFETQSTNVIDSGNIYYFLLYSQYEKLCDQLLTRKPQMIFINRFGEEWMGYLKKCASDTYEFAENIGFLDRWERKDVLLE